MMRGMILEAQIPPYWDEKSKRKPGLVNIEKTMERSTMFNGKIRRITIFNGKITIFNR